MTLEQRLDRLEAIVTELENDRLDLTAALALFEEGVICLRDAAGTLGEAEARVKQLTELGAVVRPFSFPDHHAFTRAEARTLAAEANNSDFVVCTLKDAVKLESLWPAEAGSLWYVSQRLRIEDGRQHIDRLIEDLSSSSTR